MRRRPLLALSLLLLFGCRPSSKTAPDTLAVDASRGGTSPDAATDAAVPPRLPPDAGLDVDAYTKRRRDDGGSVALVEPTGRSRPPGEKDWEEAPDLANVGTNAGCELTQIKEWVRVRCDAVGAISLLAGADSDLSLEVVEDVPEPVPDGGEPENFPFGIHHNETHGTATFALRKGDRRVIQFLGIEFGAPSYEGEGTPDRLTPGHVLTVAWIPGEAGPLVTLD